MSSRRQQVIHFQSSSSPSKVRALAKVFRLHALFTARLDVSDHSSYNVVFQHLLRA